jgi:hypothetical protein
MNGRSNSGLGHTSAAEINKKTDWSGEKGPYADFDCRLLLQAVEADVGKTLRWMQTHSCNRLW